MPLSFNRFSLILLCVTLESYYALVVVLVVVLVMVVVVFYRLNRADVDKIASSTRHDGRCTRPMNWSIALCQRELWLWLQSSGNAESCLLQRRC